MKKFRFCRLWTDCDLLIGFSDLYVKLDTDGYFPRPWASLSPSAKSKLVNWSFSLCTVWGVWNLLNFLLISILASYFWLTLKRSSRTWLMSLTSRFRWWVCLILAISSSVSCSLKALISLTDKVMFDGLTLISDLLQPSLVLLEQKLNGVSLGPG